jgi:FkbM family methyltransferase
VTYYSQNGEDRIIEELLSPLPEFARYIDVGANHPTRDNVTKYFYDKGWRGVNVEPLRHQWVLLEKERPQDINLCKALASSTLLSHLVLRQQPTHDGGLSTLVEEYAKPDWRFDVVETDTLANICDLYLLDRYAFLKIDVEGYEREVLEGADFARHRPEVICIEAFRPMTEIPTHHEWEHILLQAGYKCVRTDVANRYYMEAK